MGQISEIDPSRLWETISSADLAPATMGKKQDVSLHNPYEAL